MTDDRAARLAAIRERVAKATPGPWDHGGSTVDGGEWVWERSGHATGDPDAPDTRVCDAGSRDAAFIAHAREDVPWLLGELDDVVALLGRGIELVDDSRVEKCDELRAQLAAAEEREARLREALRWALSHATCFTDHKLIGGECPFCVNLEWAQALLDAPAKDGENGK